MKKLRLKVLYLLSMTEKAAKKAPFHPNVTVIKGENDVGKSSLIKSIYWCLGAEPAIVNPGWKKANVFGLLEFTIDEKPYNILRTGTLFLIFDENRNLLLKTTDVSKELAPFMADILDFSLVLTNRAGAPDVPPPAYCFLPFYIDQDYGWRSQWSSFDNLGQYEDWKPAVIMFHSGIRPNAYFEINAALNVEKQAKSILENQRNIVQGALSRIQERRKHAAIDIDHHAYQKAIKELLQELSGLQERRTTITEKLSELSNQRTSLDEQLSITRTALGEFDKDYRFILDQRSPTIRCPTCGTDHNNSFFHRFSLLEDREACRKFIVDAVTQLDRLSRDISRQQEALKKADFRLSKINLLLAQKRGKIKLKDVIDAEGEKKAYILIRGEIDSFTSKIDKIRRRIEDLESSMKPFLDKENQERIEKFYFMKILKFLHELNVTKVSAKNVERIDCKIKATGSNRPRALLAYTYAFLHTLFEFSSSCACPIIIDSPKQEDLDDKNAEAAFRLIFREQPKDSQLILGTVSLHDVPHAGDTITLSHKDRLLQADEYESVFTYMRPLIDLI